MALIDPSRLAAVALSCEEMSRYARHLVIPEVGSEGQRKLAAARVLCIGTGGLGSPIALYLAAAGVGCLGLVDADTVDASNLQRQILHGTRDVGRKKLESARDRLAEVNPHVCLELHDTRFNAANALDLVADYDLVIDGTDNFPTRYVSNDACVLLKKPNIYGAIHRFEGQVTVFAPHLGGGCYRCMMPEPPPAGSVPSCAEAGVLGVLPGVIGTMQAIEAIKLILGIGETLAGRLVHFDALQFQFREFRLRRDAACAVCGEHPTITAPFDTETTSCTMNNAPVISVTELKAKMDRGEKFTLVDVREVDEYEVCSLPGAVLIPLGELPARIGELNPADEIILQCKSGGRSLRALQFLQAHGFQNLANLTGGIMAWADEIDPSLPRYW
jgi:adenylyltransferase/sulfurtransferase